MPPVLAIAFKDLRERFRDRSALLYGLVVPLGIAFVLNLTVAGATGGGFTLDLAVADDDGGPVATAFLDLLETLHDDGLVDRLEIVEAATARALAEDGEVAAAFLIPDGLSAAVASNQPARIDIIADPDAQIGPAVARAIATGFAAEVGAVQRAVATVASLQGAPPDPSLIAAAARARIPVTVEDVLAESNEFDFATFYATGMAVFFVFFAAQFGVLGLLEERDAGTLVRLLAAPISRASIVLGKVLAGFFLGVFSMVSLWAGTSVLMGAAWGDPLGVLAVIVAAVLAASGLGAFLVSIARNAEQAGGYTSIVAVVLGVLGGTFFPVSQVSSGLAAVSRLTPHAWITEAFGDLAAGDTVADIWPLLLPVVGFGLVLGLVGIALARRRVVGT